MLESLLVKNIKDWFGLMLPKKSFDRLPKRIILTIFLLCLLPITLNFLGISFASPKINLSPDVFSLTPVEKMDHLHHNLSGSFTHTILEWSAVCTSIFTVILAFTYFQTQKDMTTPVIGVAVFCAGLIDAFHTLIADRLLDTVADNQNLIPFTWAICRLFNSLILLLGASIFLIIKPYKWFNKVRFILAVSLGFGIIAYSIIHWCATREVLPQTVFPNHLITRPFDVIPLLIYLILGLWIFPQFDKRFPSLFSHALIISTIPNAMTQLHMVFGSIALFDNHFNIAHFLKIVSYFVPLLGLILDYTYTHQKLTQEITERQYTLTELEQSQELLLRNNHQLEETLYELKETQSHLVQAEKMSGLGQMVAGIAHEINNPINFIYGNLVHLNQYSQDLFSLLDTYEQEYPEEREVLMREKESIDLEFLKQDIPKIIQSMKEGSERIRNIILSLRNFSRLDEADFKEVDLNEGIENTLTLLSHRINRGIMIIKSYGDLPEIECYPSQLNQVWMNLISNSIDSLEAKKNSNQYHHFIPEIKLMTEISNPNQVRVIIRDNGMGIAPNLQSRIFDPFFTTKPIGQGTGLGLSISYQVIQKHQGFIRIESQEQEWTKVEILLPVQQLS